MSLTTEYLQRIDVRIAQYLEAINYHLIHTKFPIVLVENTGYDFTPHFQKEVNSGRMEILTFQGNELSYKYGKGYGEQLIMKYAFEKSLIIREQCSCVIKATGRHMIYNATQLYRLVKFFARKKEFVAANLIGHHLWVTSDLFIASRNFFEEYLFHTASKLNNTEYCMENALYDAIINFHKDGYHVIQLPYSIRQSGKWGFNNQDLSKMILSSHRFGVKCFIMCVLNELHLRKMF